MFEFSCAFSFVYIFKISYISYDTGTGEPDETYEFVYDTVWKDKLLEITVTYDGQSYPLPVASYDAIGNPTLLFDAVLSLLFSKALASFRKVIAVCIVWTVIQ